MKKNAALARVPASRADSETLDAFDALVLRAAGGDARAVGAIAIALGPTLLREAIDTLGRDWADDAADVLQDFFRALLERRCRFQPTAERAGPWMNRVVRALARAHRDARAREWSVDELS